MDKLCVLRQFVSISIVRQFVSRSIDFHDISCQYFLERLSLIFVCRETKGCYHDVTLVEPARRQVAQHGAHILVFKLRAQLLQHDVALLDAARLLFRTLYAEDLALAYHFQNLCFHFLIMSHGNHGNHRKAARWSFFWVPQRSSSARLLPKGRKKLQKSQRSASRRVTLATKGTQEMRIASDSLSVESD